MTAETPSSRGRFVDGWRLSVGTLTAVPVRPPSRIDRDVAGRAMLLAPLSTLPITLIWVLCGVGALFVAVPWIWAALAVTGMVLATRAMHLDGLADTADGLSASYDRDRALQVMKTGDVGPSGAAAITLTLLLQVVATATLFAVPSPRAVVLGALAVAASRLGLACACRRGVPAARPGGLGATVAESVTPAALAAVSALTVLVGGVALGLAPAPWGAGPWAPSETPPAATAIGALCTLALVMVVTATTTALVRRCVRRLGGITGDVLGAAVEMSCATALVTAAILATLLV